MKDLFEHYEELPANIQAIIESFDDEKDLYAECKRLQKELKPHGYTFEYGLDGVPYDLRIARPNHRIITADGRAKFTGGTETGSWFHLNRAKELVDHAAGEMIYEYSDTGERLWEVM